MQDVFIHSTAVVDPGAKIGKGTKLWHFSHICGTDVEIGPDCSFGQNTYVGPRVKIGRGCRVQNNVSIYDLVELGDYVFCGPSVVFTNVINPRAHVSRKNEFQKTIVRSGVSLGANATIICGIEIGRFAFVAAGAVVSRTLAPFALAVGVPAKVVGWMCHCGIQLQGQGKCKCSACGSEYEISGLSICTPLALKNCFEAK
jgi:UDP-2-acetamido-3-amino-2,3-dideoxy-glucuronate N-acetyltransferase